MLPYHYVNKSSLFFTVSSNLKFSWQYILLILVILAGIFLHSVDRFNEESEHSVDRSGAPSTMPLLKEDTIETTESIAEL